jgi:hypothetical protein
VFAIEDRVSDPALLIPDYLPHTRYASLTICQSLLRDVEHPIALSLEIVQPVGCGERRMVISVRTSAMRVPPSATQFANPQGYRIVHRVSYSRRLQQRGDRYG